MPNLNAVLTEPASKFLIMGNDRPKVSFGVYRLEFSVFVFRVFVFSECLFFSPFRI